MTGEAATAYRGAPDAAIRHHYDLGNDFYGLWLDPTLTYSCALWEGDDDTLEAAQRRKLDFVARAAGVRPGARVLDVGCGWGSLVRRLVEAHGAGRVVGLTLSPAQARVAAARVGADAGGAGGRAAVRLENWIDHDPSARYDAVVSVGAFEHFAGYGLPRAERVRAYRAFFERCRAWLPPGGRLVVQTITKGNNPRLTREVLGEMRFVAQRIFPDSELPWLSEVFEASRLLFDPVSVRNDPDDYARTCRCWLDRLRARRPDAEALVGPEAVADYERYLGGAVRGFAERYLGLARLVFERP